MVHKLTRKRCDVIAANIRIKDALEAARQLSARAELLLARRSRDPILRQFAEREAAVCLRLADALLATTGAGQ